MCSNRIEGLRSDGDAPCDDRGPSHAELSAAPLTVPTYSSNPCQRFVAHFGSRDDTGRRFSELDRHLVDVSCGGRPYRRASSVSLLAICPTSVSAVLGAVTPVSRRRTPRPVLTQQ